MVYHAPSIPPLYKQVGIYARVSSRSPEQMNSLTNWSLSWSQQNKKNCTQALYQNLRADMARPAGFEPTVF